MHFLDFLFIFTIILANMDKSKLISSILSAMNSKISTDELLNYLLDNCINLINGVSGSIILINDKTKILDIRAFRGLKENIVNHTKLKIGEGVTGKVAETGEPLIVNDVEKIDFYITVNPTLKSEMAVPLKFNNKVIGVVSIDSDKKNNFKTEDMEIMMSIANIASQILYRATLLETLEKKIERQNLLIEIARILERDDNLKEIFYSIMEKLSEAILIKRGMLVLIDEKNKLKIFTGFKISEDAISKGIYEIGEGITGKTVKYGNPIAIKNIFESKEFLNKMKIKRNRKIPISFISVPLKYKKSTIGVISVEKNFINDDEFSEDVNLLILLSSLISNKVENYERNRKEKEKLIKENLQLRNKIKKSVTLDFIGKNKEIEQIKETIDLVADTNASVLITGETGTGKEIVARLIHYNSTRWDKPFISINCAAIPDNLLESELFGYQKGAFTGAASNKRGKFLLANNGTLFLDEIGDMSKHLQAKILRALQEKVIQPLGSEHDVKINVRVIAATNQDLANSVESGNFRQDLFYRLNVISLNIPALRERKDDIPLLVNYFIDKFNKQYNKNIKSIAPAVLEIFINYDWPGNVRELENVLERAIILSRGDIINIENLPDNIKGESFKSEHKTDLDRVIESELTTLFDGEIYYKVINKVEKMVIENALVKANNKQNEAARLLGIHRNTLRQKIRQFKINL